MCYNYYNDIAVARSVYRRQSNQSVSNLNETTRNSNRIQQNRSRSDHHQSTRSNQTAMKQVLLDKEYSNLKSLLPTLNNKAKVSKVNLINEAVRYISELQEQVIQKLNGDPHSMQQKILEMFEQQIKSSEHSSNNNFHNSSIRSNSSSVNRLQSNKIALRRTPLEEINLQKSAKRKRI